MLSLERNKKGMLRKTYGKKRLVYFDLLYWPILDVRHCFYVIRTLQKIQGKTKDGKNSRLDMVQWVYDNNWL